MYFVYSLQSESVQDRYYIGITENIERRLKEHNHGDSVFTSKYKPWKLVFYVAFENKEKAIKFETYLKSGSGRNFAKRHF